MCICIHRLCTLFMDNEIFLEFFHAALTSDFRKFISSWTLIQYRILDFAFLPNKPWNQNQKYVLWNINKLTKNAGLNILNFCLMVTSFKKSVRNSFFSGNPSKCKEWMMINDILGWNSTELIQLSSMIYEWFFEK